MPYLVDGNNLAHALGLSNGGLADRQACARAIATFCQAQGAKATVVFDGPPPEGPVRPGGSPRVRVVWSGARSADDAILKTLSSSSTPRDFVVVTSDKSLGDKARHRGATLEKCHEFARRLRRPASASHHASGKTDRALSPAEVEAWLSVFDPSRKA